MSDQPWLSRNSIIFWGFILATVAGFINLVMLHVFVVPISHMTGVTTRLAQVSVIGDDANLILLLSIVAAFVVGAMVSGFVLDNHQLHEQPAYGWLLIAEALIITTAMWMAEHGDVYAVALGAFAAGLQNAMAGVYRAMSIRTTHVTGSVTDIGVMLGAMLRGHKIQHWRLAMMLLLWVGFFIGGVLGDALYQVFQLDSLMFAAASLALMGVAYLICHRRPATSSAL